MNKTKTETTRKFTNDIIEDHGDWLLVDISTSKFPEATMAVDTDVFDAHKGGRISARQTSGSRYIYAGYMYKQKPYLLHRDVIDAGELHVDHIDPTTKIYIDNRRRNLRACTHSQNKQNSRKYSNNTSGIPGVCWSKKDGVWHSRISVNGKLKHLGSFDNIEFAIGARKQAEREYYGEYAFGGAK